MAPAGRASRRIAGDVTTVGVEDATSIERIVTGAVFAGAAMTKRDCAGEAKRHSVSSSSMRWTWRTCSRLVIARLSCIWRRR